MHIHPLEINRMTVEMTELTVGQSLSVSHIPSTLYEQQITKMLRYCVTSAIGVDADPINWTVQERYLAISHYLSCSYASDDDGDGYNFTIGSGNYFDYLDFSLNAPASNETLNIGELGGDNWNIRHLTGAMAEAIETTCGTVDTSKTVHFLVGSMAAQLFITGEKPPEFELKKDLYDWMANRIETFLAYPERDFISLLNLFYVYRKQLNHFFDVRDSHNGFVIYSTKKPLLTNDKGEVVTGLVPTRFLAIPCLTRQVTDLSRLP